MKRFLTVFEFELMSYVKNKSFMVTTILMAVILGVVMFLPRFIDMSDMLGIESDTKQETVDNKDDEDKAQLGIVDEKEYFADATILKEAFPEAEFTFYKSEDALKQAVEKEEVETGFCVIDDTNYRYYVLNSDMFDDNQMVFESIMSVIHKQIYCAENNLDYAAFTQAYETPITCDQKVLGKDAAENYWYCYALVIIIFMLIIMYGVMIATSVTTEKSNRTVEVLVTSIDSKYLLFGKVFAGAVAVIIQVGLILGAVLIGYGLNHDAWGGKLDMVLDIPGEVLGTFAIFGLGGFLFYAFLYGALGALVSKTEDINKSVGSLQMIIMVVYFAVLFQLQNVDGIIMKICSFLPFSSYSAMFVRVSMGNVATWEIIVSIVILVVSIFAVGWLGGKIYRMGTLRYGNPIKLSHALKNMKQE